MFHVKCALKLFWKIIYSTLLKIGLFFFAEYLDACIGDEGEEEPLRSSIVRTLERSRVFGFEGMNPAVLEGKLIV